VEGDDDAPLRRAKILTVSRDAHRDSVLRALIERSEDLQDLGNARSLLQVERLLSKSAPHIAIIEGASLGKDRDLVLDAVRSARVRHVVRFSDEADPSDRSILATSILDDQDPQRLHAVSVRLSLLASRCVRGPRKLSSTSLRAATAAAVASGASVREKVRRIVDAPLELIVVFGGRGARGTAEGTLLAISRVRVPTVFAVDDGPPLDVESLRTMTHAPLRTFDESLMLKRLPREILIPTRPRGLFFERTSVCISRVEQDGLGGPIASVAELGSAAVLVLLAGSDHGLPSALATADKAGVATFVLEPKRGTASTAVEIAMKQGAAGPISSGELTWMIENAVPLRA
jgi:hypothetical protein